MELKLRLEVSSSERLLVPVGVAEAVSPREALGLTDADLDWEHESICDTDRVTDGVKETLQELGTVCDNVCDRVLEPMAVYVDLDPVAESVEDEVRDPCNV